jgi:hypothetical protein
MVRLDYADSFVFVRSVARLALLRQYKLYALPYFGPQRNLWSRVRPPNADEKQQPANSYHFETITSRAADTTRYCSKDLRLSPTQRIGQLGSSEASGLQCR